MKKTIITNIQILKKPCLIVTKDEDISNIIQDLKDTLDPKKGYALAANQIGYNKCVCYFKMPDGTEFIAINPVIIEKDHKIILQQEGCLSFPGLRIDTDRYIYCTIQYEDEQRKQQLGVVQDLESFIWQHECDHLKGRTIFDAKHRRK